MIIVNDINEACIVAEALMLKNYWVKISKSPVVGDDNHYIVDFKEDEE